MKVVFLGCTSNYGFGFSADVTKVGFIAKGLTEAGAKCSIHNGIVGSSNITQEQTVIVDGLPVTTFKKKGNQLFSYLRNIGRQYKYLKKEKEPNGKNVIIVIMPFMHIFLTYWIMSRLLGYKFVVISHEWGTTLKENNKLREWMQHLFARTFGWFADGILPISEYIIKKIEHFKKPIFKLPIMADFNTDEKDEERNKKNFVYCASVFYSRIIKMIIDSFVEFSTTNDKTGLTLILNGPENYKEDIAKYIESKSASEKIYIKSKLPYEELLNEYYNAKALIIPLDPNYEQDEARFSQKIAEYLSSGSPIITNNVGEIKHYFQDDEIIKCEYTIEGFAKAFMWVCNYEEKAKEIGIKGRKRGLKEFDYRNLGKGMSIFLENL